LFDGLRLGGARLRRLTVEQIAEPISGGDPGQGKDDEQHLATGIQAKSG
jgi:hypothetical protein